MRNKKLKLILILLLAILSLTGIFIVMIPAVFADTSAQADTFFNGGTGTEDDPYQISTVTQLNNLADLVNNGNEDYNQAHYILTADIKYGMLDDNGYQITPSDYIPIGVSYTNRAFQGVFDGNGYMISGPEIEVLNVNTNGSIYYWYYGIFGRVENATIKNLLVRNVTYNFNNYYSGTPKYFGGIVGYAMSSIIDNCSIETVVLNFGSSLDASLTTYFGGIAGVLGDANSVISNCYIKLNLDYCRANISISDDKKFSQFIISNICSCLSNVSSLKENCVIDVYDLDQEEMLTNIQKVVTSGNLYYYETCYNDSGASSSEVNVLVFNKGIELDYIEDFKDGIMDYDITKVKSEYVNTSEYRYSEGGHWFWNGTATSCPKLTIFQNKTMLTFKATQGSLTIGSALAEYLEISLYVTSVTYEIEDTCIKLSYIYNNNLFEMEIHADYSVDGYQFLQWTDNEGVFTTEYSAVPTYSITVYKNTSLTDNEYISFSYKKGEYKDLKSLVKNAITNTDKYVVSLNTQRDGQGETINSTSGMQQNLILYIQWGVEVNYACCFDDKQSDTSVIYINVGDDLNFNKSSLTIYHCQDFSNNYFQFTCPNGYKFSHLEIETIDGRITDASQIGNYLRDIDSNITIFAMFISN